MSGAPDPGAAAAPGGPRALGERPATAIDVLLVTGLSGAGRSTAAKLLEDLGWYVADNVPPQLVPTLVDYGLSEGTRIERLAVVVDVRSKTFSGDLAAVGDEVVRRGGAPRILFLDASDHVLVRRFEQVRRGHPLQRSGTLAEAIAAERAMLATLRMSADVVIDTSSSSVQRFREKMETLFGGSEPRAVRVTVQSFGFKYGLPTDADMVADVRFLSNPFWVEELRGLTGRDAAVSEYVLAEQGASEFLRTYSRLVQLTIDGYQREGKFYVTTAIGCTGGKHRSVAMSEALGALLAENPALGVGVVHRDLGRE
ncbi:RNase adapter RapZ [Tomitella fengzijianii]|uniref:RNase adapter RapZ n=1 Tax=Tomitella fengzijianii TaxID=2597660 RepID=A0A516X813_9ACTN|nr:RNase adapter RapZ [Tomitella fengzijianii]